jgi:hypothetical protein
MISVCDTPELRFLHFKCHGHWRQDLENQERSISGIDYDTYIYISACVGGGVFVT